MKTKTILLTLLLTIAGSTLAGSATARMGRMRERPLFHDELQPYGTWMRLRDHGWAWKPRIMVNGSSWRPYCDNGQWVWTSHGWYWKSFYPWGSVAFHYGRWLLSSEFGWVWMPGSEWAPAWVSWRYSDRFCGWAPLPPDAHARTGVSIGYSRDGLSLGFSLNLPHSHFVFVPRHRFHEPQPRTHMLSRHDVPRICRETTVYRSCPVPRRSVELRTYRYAPSLPSRRSPATQRVVRSVTRTPTARTPHPASHGSAVTAAPRSRSAKTTPAASNRPHRAPGNTSARERQETATVQTQGSGNRRSTRTGSVVRRYFRSR